MTLTFSEYPDRTLTYSDGYEAGESAALELLQQLFSECNSPEDVETAVTELLTDKGYL